METFISMKSDAECNETTPAISFDRFKENYEILTTHDIKSLSVSTQIVELKKKQGQIWNQRPLKRTGPLWTLPIKFYLTSENLWKVGLAQPKSSS